jgi:adenylosuccinate synthase
MKRAVIVQGLGFGDEGKGATVDFLAREFAADLVVRHCGGSQAAHNVVLPDGRRHVFAQFGSGTFTGAATYLGEQVIINPSAMHAEARHLHDLMGDDPFAKLLVHPRALVSTVYHQQLNRLRELSRGADRHGSCGHGIGETRHYWLRYGSDAIFAADLKGRAALSTKLELMRQRMLIEAQVFIDRVPIEEQGRLEFFMEPVGAHVADLALLGIPIELSAEPPDFSTAIFEGAQGVLLDEWRGFHPYTTWSTVTLHHALAMIEPMGVDETCMLGLTRAYQTRHGAGPLPTRDRDLDARLSDRGNPANAWQGVMRRGWLDLVLLRYAVEAAGAPFDGLVVNNLDELADLAPKICIGYRLPDGSEIDRLPVAAAPNLAAQQRLTAILEQAAPIYEPTSRASIASRLAEAFASLAITATGPTWHDRDLHNVRFRRGFSAKSEPAASAMTPVPAQSPA